MTTLQPRQKILNHFFLLRLLLTINEIETTIIPIPAIDIAILTKNRVNSFLAHLGPIQEGYILAGFFGLDTSIIKSIRSGFSESLCKYSKSSSTNPYLNAKRSFVYLKFPIFLGECISERSKTLHPSDLIRKAMVSDKQISRK